MLTTDSSRVADVNGWFEVKGNPLSKVGVFPYSGSAIGDTENPNKVYMVYRPAESLSDPETINSFKLIPWVDDHAMLGDEEEGLMPAEKKGVQGVIGEDVYYKNGVLYGNVKVFSSAMASLINDGKVELSCGYRCNYIPESGIINGQKYDAIQTDIRGNHLALVEEGRMGKDVRVLDGIERFTFTIDAKELVMAEPTAEAGAEPTLSEVIAMVKAFAPQIAELQKAFSEMSKVHAEPEGDEPPMVDADEEIVEEAPVADMGAMCDSDPAKEEKAVATVDASEFKALSDKVEALTKNGVKTIMKEIAVRDHLAKQLSTHIGTFDHAEKTVSEVAQYGIEKLGLKCEDGAEVATLHGYLAGKNTMNPTFALDSFKAKTGVVDNYLNGKE